MKNIRKINLSNITGKLTREEMKTIMAGSSCNYSCTMGACGGGCGCNGSTCTRI